MVHLRVLVFLGCVRNHHKSRDLKQHPWVTIWLLQASNQNDLCSQQWPKIQSCHSREQTSPGEGSCGREPPDIVSQNILYICQVTGGSISQWGIQPTQLLASYPVSGSGSTCPSLHCHQHLNVTSLDKPPTRSQYSIPLSISIPHLFPL